MPLTLLGPAGGSMMLCGDPRRAFDPMPVPACRRSCAARAWRAAQCQWVGSAARQLACWCARCLRGKETRQCCMNETARWQEQGLCQVGNRGGALRRQLGPVVRSLHAQRGGLATSMLERLIAHHKQLAPQYTQRGVVAPSSEAACRPDALCRSCSRNCQEQPNDGVLAVHAAC